MKLLLAAISAGVILLSTSGTVSAQHGGYRGGYYGGGGYRGGYSTGFYAGYRAPGIGVSVGFGSPYYGRSYYGGYYGGYYAPRYIVPSVTYVQPSVTYVQPQVVIPVAPASATFLENGLTPEQDASPTMIPGYDLHSLNGRYWHTRK